MDELPIGRRVAYWRGQRKMSQQVFADRIGRSKSWVDKVERGDRRLDKFSMLYQIAVVLQIDVAMLLNRDPERGSSPSGSYDQRELDDLRQALERSAPVAPLGRAPATPLHELAQSVNHAWLTYQYARYGVLVRGCRDCCATPRRRTRTTVATPGGRRRACSDRCSRSPPRRCGSSASATWPGWPPTGRSGPPGEPRTTCSRRWRPAGWPTRSWRWAGPARPSRRTWSWPTGSPRPTSAPPTRPTCRCTGHCCSRRRWRRPGSATTRACTTCSGGRRGGEDARRGPERILDQLRPDQRGVAPRGGGGRAGDGRQAVSIHAHQLNHRALAGLLPERRAHHLLDLARGYLLVGETGCAGEALVEADRVAPWEIRGRPIAHELMADILRRTKGTAPALVTELATQMGARV